ncbi:hypothetical protein [Deinococcus altitudinis]|uniref:hypothetical protein n=1 Tax=Deinococcus altitudinis TaxID=468914 RepID=UPI003891CA81
MAYIVMVTRPTEDPQNPRHHFRLSDDHGQARVFNTQAEAQEALVQHLARFPADEGSVVPATEAQE